MQMQNESSANSFLHFTKILYPTFDAYFALLAVVGNKADEWIMYLTV